MEKRRFCQDPLTIVLTVVIVFLFSLFVNSNGANAQKTLKIGGAFELTGDASGMGFPESEGIKLAVAEIHEKGGIKIGGETYKLDLLLYDTRANPSEAVGIAEKLITREKVKVIFGGAASVSGMAVQELTQPAKVIQIGVGWTAIQKLLGKPGKEYLFKASPYEGGERGTAAHFIPFVVQKYNLKSVAIMMPATESGRVYVECEKKFFDELKVKVETVEFYNPKLTDFYPQLSKIKPLNPDALGVGYTDDGVIPILRQAKELGIKSRLIGLGAGMSEKAAYAMGADKPIEGYIWISYFPPLSDPKVIDFCNRYTKFFNKKCASDIGFAIWMYETLEHVLWAMQKVGSTTDTNKIASTLKGHKFEGIVTREYNEEGLGISNYWVAEVKSGNVVWSYVPLKK
jgi:branched-chain amino acid transport system substrate-binding protein